MIWLWDNDIIYKLAVLDLAQETMAAFGITFTDIHVLPTARHKFGLTKNLAKARAKYGGEAFGRLQSFLSQVQELGASSPMAELDVLAQVDDIDPGEAVLFAATANFTEFRLATGDKRSLRALTSAESCRAIAERLQGSVVCLEQLISGAIRHSGFVHVRSKVVIAPGCDTALQAAFGSGPNATESNVEFALARYVQDVRKLPIDLLVE